MRAEYIVSEWLKAAGLSSVGSRAVRDCVALAYIGASAASDDTPLANLASAIGVHPLRLNSMLKVSVIFSERAITSESQQLARLKRSLAAHSIDGVAEQADGVRNRRFQHQAHVIGKKSKVI